jgi:hypothetical protein
MGIAGIPHGLVALLDFFDDRRWVITHPLSGAGITL